MPLFISQISQLYFESCNGVFTTVPLSISLFRQDRTILFVISSGRQQTQLTASSSAVPHRRSIGLTDDSSEPNRRYHRQGEDRPAARPQTPICPFLHLNIDSKPISTAASAATDDSRQIRRRRPRTNRPLEEEGENGKPRENRRL